MASKHSETTSLRDNLVASLIRLMLNPDVITRRQMHVDDVSAYGVVTKVTSFDRADGVTVLD